MGNTQQKDHNLITLTINGTQVLDTRLEVLEGVEYIVAPVVAAQHQVLNGELVTADELGKYVEAWNGIALVAGHPKINGVFVSANDPQILEQWQIGKFFHAAIDGSRLVGEVWINHKKARELGGDALTILEAIERGDEIEVSTGYFRDLIPVIGKYNGKDYYGIATNLRPDHLAILPPGEIGACSWVDGCGVRANESEGAYRVPDVVRVLAHRVLPSLTKECEQSIATNLANGAPIPQDQMIRVAGFIDAIGKDPQRYGSPDRALITNAAATQVEPLVRVPHTVTRGPITNAHKSGIMVALLVPLEAAPLLIPNAEDLPDGSQPSSPGLLHITLAYMGHTDDADFDVQRVLDEVINFAQHTPVIPIEIGGVARFSVLDDIDGQGMTPYVLLTDSPVIGEFRDRLVEGLVWGAGARVSRDHTFTPHITVAYLPADQPTPGLLPDRVGIEMGQIVLAWGDLVFGFPLQGELVDVEARDATAASNFAASLARLDSHINEVKTMSNMHDDATNVATNDDQAVDDTQQQDAAGADTTDQGADTVTDAGSDQADGTDEGTDDEGTQHADDGQVDDGPGIDMAVLTAQVERVVTVAVNKAIKPYKEALDQLQANRNTERQTLIGEIVANSNMAKAQLDPLPDETLQALHGSVVQPCGDFRGNGGLPTTNGANGQQGDEQVVALAMPSLDERGSD